MGWRELIAIAEEAVDGQFGEQVKFLPYRSGVYMASSIPDSSRSQADIVAVIYARGSTGSRGGDAAMMSKRMEADFLASVQGRYLPDVREVDRLQLIERDNVVYEISFVELGSNGRYLLHLVKNIT